MKLLNYSLLKFVQIIAYEKGLDRCWWKLRECSSKCVKIKDKWSENDWNSTEIKETSVEMLERFKFRFWEKLKSEL